MGGTVTLPRGLGVVALHEPSQQRSDLLEHPSAIGRSVGDHAAADFRERAISRIARGQAKATAGFRSRPSQSLRTIAG